MTHPHGMEPIFVPRAKLILEQIMDKVEAIFVVRHPLTGAAR